MNLFLTLAYLFFIGSTLGWVAELLYRISRRQILYLTPEQQILQRFSLQEM